MINPIAPYQFAKEKHLISSCINLDKHLPDMVFNKEFNQFLFLDFHNLFSQDFFQVLQTITANLKEQNFCFAVLDPHPENYFYRHFKKYSVFRIPKNEAYEHFFQVLNKVHDGSPADAFIHNSGTITYYSENGQKYVVYGERELSIGIVAFRDLVIRQLFLEKNSRIFFNFKVAIEIVSTSFANGTIPLGIKEELQKNYGE